MRILVTGATGFVGSRLTDRLGRDGHTVVGLARSPASAQKLVDRGTKFVQGDLSQLPAVRAATVLHRGSYAALEGTRGALLDWMASAGLVPAGTLRVLYLQFGAEEDLRLPSRYLVDRAADLVTELQVPLA